MSNIEMKEKYITWVYDGVEVEARVEYWSKDFMIEMIKPFRVDINKGHMLFMAPIIYDFWEDLVRERCNDRMTVWNLYPRMLDDCNKWLDAREDYIKTERYARAFANLHQNAIEVSDLIQERYDLQVKAKELRTRLKNELISPREYQISLGNGKKRINDIKGELQKRVEVYVDIHYPQVLPETFDEIMVDDPEIWHGSGYCQSEPNGNRIAKHLLKKIVLNAE